VVHASDALALNTIRGNEGWGVRGKRRGGRRSIEGGNERGCNGDLSLRNVGWMRGRGDGDGQSDQFE